MICAHCSSPVPDEARFCHSCGSLVSDAEGQAAATAAMDMSSFAHMEKLLREDTKGEFTIAQMLGRGGMAVVYLATETQLSRKVAIKVLPPELTFGHGVERFKREAKTAAALDHPNIIPIYRIASSGKLFWYAMKYLEGKSLEDMLRERGSFSLDETIEILEQVADGLDYAHEHHVIHRDIKPANVMLDNRNKVIVTDFGIAKALTEGKLTATDSVIGTPYFMSPEQGMGKTVTGASDQYSVGVMAYRMLAGHVPFDGDSAIDILHKHCMFPAPSLHDDAPHLPQHVCDAVARALSKAGDERFATVHDLVASMKSADFQPRPTARPSVATVLMDPEESKKLRSAASKPSLPSPAAKSGKGATVAHPQGAKVAAKAAAPAPRASIGAIRHSKVGLYVGAAGVLLAASVGIWAVTKGDGATNGASRDGATQSPTPINTGTGQPTGQSQLAAGDPATPAGGNAAAPATSVSSPVTEPVPAAKTVSPPVTRPPPATSRTAGATNPQKSAPARDPAPQPATEPVRQTQSPPQTQPVSAASNPAPTSPPAANPGASTAGLATLRLLLTPPATISIDGESRGQQSRFLTQFIPGSHRLRVEREGYVSKDTLVTISAGDTATVRINLEKRP